MTPGVTRGVMRGVTRVAHLSDVHFGDQPPGLARALALALRRADPAVVVVSGDLTQRARQVQFLEAKSWLDSLERPVLVVPGNHDLPLLAFWKRLLRPRRGFRQALGAETAPCWRGEGVVLCGEDSTRRWRWKAGRLRTGRAGMHLREASQAPALHVLVAHHPLSGREAPRHAPPPGVDVLLAGHAHQSRLELLPTATSATGLLQLVAGTALSRRLRGEVNSYFLADIQLDAASTATVVVRRWEHRDAGFAPAESRLFVKSLADPDAGWEERGP